MNARILVVLALLSPAAALAQDCTVCRDPMWPTIQQPMPAIPLYAAASTPNGSNLKVNATRQVAITPSTGAGVAAGVASRGVYADPMWPQVRSASEGMGASGTVPSPAKAPAAVGPVASR